jgi:hypothetical protein
MHYQETKAKVLEATIARLLSVITSKYGTMWLFNESYMSSKERVLLVRYAEELSTLNVTPHQVTDTCHE